MIALKSHIMLFHHRKFIHWLVALAIALSALAPALSQAVSLAKGGHGFAMEICSVDGNKMQINVSGDASGDQVEATQSCPYCLTHNGIALAFNTSLSFEAPQSLALLPQLFYQSPKPLAVWITPPSAAPPAIA